MLSWLPWVLGLLTIGVGAALAWYYFAGGEDEIEEEIHAQGGIDPLSITAAEDPIRDPLATTTEEYRGAGRKSRMIALKESLERSLDSREGIARGSTKDRMQMPWFMLVGADGSGKKTVLANNGLELPWGPPIEVDSLRKDAGKWWLYDEAVVLEAPAATPGTTEASSTLPPDQTVIDSSIGWSTLLHMLRRERPDSPLNGIIVTIACSDLMDARINPDKLEEQGDRIRVFLERTRRFLGVRLPLHVIVTKCDALPGFRSFANALPTARRQDIFGWSNPSDPENRFEPTWVDGGFTEIQERLVTLRDELLAAPEQVRDSVGVFVFDSEFNDLQEPLKTFVARLMPIGERRPSLFFRGFYFTGDSLEPDPTRFESTVSERAHRFSDGTKSAEVAAEPHALVFLKSLFAERIFREAGLARAASKLRLARDRRVVLAQAAALLIAVGGGFGLWNSVNGLHAADRPGSAGLKADAELMTRVLSGVAIDLDELRRGDAVTAASPFARRTRDAAVIELVGQMRAAPSVDIRSAFIPSSWFSRLPGEIRLSMMAGVRDIVLPVTRQRLMERSASLLGNGTTAHFPDELDPSDPASLPKYLVEVRALSRNIARYNSLADSTSGSFDELAGLLEYLFGERIIADARLATPDFEEALRHAAAAPIVVSPELPQTVVRRAASVVSGIGARAGVQLAPRTTEAAERAIKPTDDLKALSGLGALVQLIDAKTGLLATVGDSAILGARLARAVHDTILAQIQLAAVRIAPDTLAPDSSARRLRNVIGQLHQFRLMRPLEEHRVTSDIRPNERLRWDVGGLELALTLQSEFLQAVVTTAVAFPGQSPERLRRALELQLKQRTIDVAAGAQRFTPIGVVEDPFAEIRSQSLNLEGAAGRILRVAATLDTLGADQDAERLLTAAVRQAEQAIALAQSTFERHQYLAPMPATVAAWQGVLPFAFVALGTADSLGFASKLLDHETRVRTLVHAVGPSLRFLRLPAIEDSVHSFALVERWEEIVASVLKYERGDLSSTLGVLHRYLVSDLMANSLESCRTQAERLPEIAPSQDIFVTRQRQFRAALIGRCHPGGSASAVAAYQRLRSSFQARLAGRYPFADTSTFARVDAVVSDVQDFIGQYDDFAVTGEVALRSDPRLSQTGRAAMAFLDQVAAARTFLEPFAAIEASRERPEYGVAVSSREAADSNSVGLLEVRIGAQLLGVDQVAQNAFWHGGDSTTVTVIPFDTSMARPIFAAGGQWALLRLARRPPSAALGVTLYHPETRLELPLPVFPVTAPEILILRPR